MAAMAACHGDRASVSPRIGASEPLMRGASGTGASAETAGPGSDVALTASPRSPLAAAFATLPPSIVEAAPWPLAWMGDQLTRAPDPVLNADCWKRLAAKVDGYYGVQLADPPEQAVVHLHLVHGHVGLDELRACRGPAAPRKEPKHPRVLIASDAGFFPVVFADLGGDWLLMVDGELAPILAVAEAMVAEPATASNRLADLVGMTAAEGWHALAIDVTGRSLGVPALGVRTEFTPSRDPGLPQGLVTVAVVFASADDARRALVAAEAGGVAGPALELARARGVVRVEGATVVYRGPVSEDLAREQWTFRP